MPAAFELKSNRVDVGNEMDFSNAYDGSQVQPPVHFENHSSVFLLHEGIGEVIVCVHQENIAHGFVSPLHPAVDVEVVVLVIVLQECRPEDAVGEIHFYAGCYKEQVVPSIRIRETQSCLFNEDGEVSPWLSPPCEHCIGLQEFSVEESTGGQLRFEDEPFS
jgi:hypothetical protein